MTNKVKANITLDDLDKANKEYMKDIDRVDKKFNELTKKKIKA